MSFGTDQNVLQQTRQQAHPGCFACDPDQDCGLGLTFDVVSPGEVRARLDRIPGDFRSYACTVHGGVIATILDSAMVNCLFSMGEIAATAELTVRYHAPTLPDRPIVVTGRLARMRRTVRLLEAEIVQDGEVTATAASKFMLLPDDAPRG